MNSNATMKKTICNNRVLDSLIKFYLHSYSNSNIINNIQIREATPLPYIIP